MSTPGQLSDVNGAIHEFIRTAARIALADSASTRCLDPAAIVNYRHLQARLDMEYDVARARLTSLGTVDSYAITELDAATRTYEIARLANQEHGCLPTRELVMLATRVIEAAGVVASALGGEPGLVL